MPQPLLSDIADKLERLTPDFDRLVADARLGLPSRRSFEGIYEDLEERAQQLARAIVAPFRGDRR